MFIMPALSFLHLNVHLVRVAEILLYRIAQRTVLENVNFATRSIYFEGVNDYCLCLHVFQRPQMKFPH